LDVLVLSEVWTHNIDFYSNLFEGYHDFYFNLLKSSNVGGVAKYVMRDIFSKIKKDLYLSMKDDAQYEDIWIEVVKGKIKYIIAGIYRRPNHNNINFIASLELNLDKISKFRKPCIVAGDVNIDLMKSKENNSFTQYLNNLV